MQIYQQHKAKMFDGKNNMVANMQRVFISLYLNMETVTMHPENEEQLAALKAFAKALKVKFESNKNPYNAAFLKKIKESEKEINEGKFIVLDPNKSIWENIE